MLFRVCKGSVVAEAFLFSMSTLHARVGLIFNSNNCSRLKRLCHVRVHVGLGVLGGRMTIGGI